jgi:transposase
LLAFRKSAFPTIGIDRGVKCSRRSPMVERTTCLIGNITKKLAKLQRRLAHKVKQSANWRKLKGRISRLWHHEANARKDWLHKLSTETAPSYGIVKVEKLRVET